VRTVSPRRLKFYSSSLPSLLLVEIAEPPWQMADVDLEREAMIGLSVGVQEQQDLEEAGSSTEEATLRYRGQGSGL
jgi:hypothetical protein